MPHFLEDPAWLALIVACVGVVVAIAFGAANIKRKRVSCKVESNTLLATVSQSVADKVHLTFDGEVVKAPREVIFTVRNTGNVPVSADDFGGKPLRIQFGDEARILEAEVLATLPTTLRDELTIAHEQSAVAMPAVLLNQGSWIKFRVVVDNFGGTLTVATLIRGIPAIAVEYPEGSDLRPVFRVFGLVFVIASSGGAGGLIADALRLHSAGQDISLNLWGIALCCALAIFYSWLLVSSWGE